MRPSASWGSATETVRNVAARCDVTEERVRAYLADKNDQDNLLLRAFLFYGVGPINKTFV